VQTAILSVPGAASENARIAHHAEIGPAGNRREFVVEPLLGIVEIAVEQGEPRERQALPRPEASRGHAYGSR